MAAVRIKVRLNGSATGVNLRIDPETTCKEKLVTEALVKLGHPGSSSVRMVVLCVYPLRMVVLFATRVRFCDAHLSFREGGGRGGGSPGRDLGLI